VTSDSLTLTFAPTGNSLAFINAIEVVSVPDQLMANQPATLPPSAPLLDSLDMLWWQHTGSVLGVNWLHLRMTLLVELGYLIKVIWLLVVLLNLSVSLPAALHTLQQLLHRLPQPCLCHGRWDGKCKSKLPSVISIFLSLPTPYYTDFVVNAPSGSRVKCNAAKAGVKFMV
jgi:hypothetical protein